MSCYARAHRGRWDHPLFKNKQEAAVWAWMTDTARFKAHSFQTQFGMVHLERGQLLVSQRSIEDDFGLGRQKVRRLISSMVAAGMIAENSTHSASRAGTIITIVNYERYQSDVTGEATAATQGQPERQPKTNPRATQDQPTREEREKREKGEERPSVSSPLPGEGAGGELDEPRGELIPFPVADAATDAPGAAMAAFETLRREFAPASRPLQLSADRRSKLAARLREVGGSVGWMDVLARIRGSPFLRGETSRNGFVAIDWLLEPKNLRKVIEGNYDDHTRTGSRRPGGPVGTVDAMRAARTALGLGGS